MAGNSIKVLLVEDNPGDVFLLQELLQEVTTAKVELQPAEQLCEALECIARDSFDVILLDLSLPDSQGLDTFISTARQTKATPIIVLTGLNDETLALRAMQSGAQDYLVKGQVTGDLLVRSMRYAIERQRSENALRQSEERFRVALKNSPIFVFNQDINLSYTWVYNPMSGWTSQDMLGKHDCDLIPDKDAQGLTAIKHSVLTNGIGIREEVSITTPLGTRYYDLTVEPLRNESQEIVGITCAGIDISERKLSEAKIREQAALLDITTDAICVCDLENQIQFWNKGAETLYGWQVQEAVGRNFGDILDNEAAQENHEALLSVMTKGKWEGELTQITKTGKEILVASRWSLVRDAQGRPKSILIVDTDITEKKRLESQLFRTQRLESIGTLASGIAHDLNNILTPILAGAQLLPLKFPDADERTKRLLEILEINAKRGADLVKQVLSFARGVEGKRITLQIRHLIVEIAKILKETFPKSIEIHTNIPNELWLVSGDSTQLHQVVMNLCVNARDAMPHRGILSISAENFVVDENYARMNLEAEAGLYVVITVTDTGVGIPQETLDRIFEPFFTTKPVGQGTGLGLSTVIGIVKSHGGFINVYSEVGNGTSFKVYLPAVGGTETLAVEDVAIPTGHGELILIVDDEPSIQDVTRNSLESHQYQTLIASDGIEAIALYAKYADKISAVLMDMMLPSLDGVTAIRTLQKINPQVKIIATSGLMSKTKLGEVMDTGTQTFLPKPYTVNELLLSLQQILK
ncbi:response regulator [Nodularia spumigena CS-584]|jgi:PAS domain S-box-containing protein|uniref:hybrid sensor histidine kinase/response regulator n=1 Tax=Nodularia spumigena TaxID=70799 RepID=UPI0000EA9741|nr:response regulator [Nodularia spumigena]AHJ31129.1 two-component hybrid sensor and regulator [Nodularia spumigena CCY9414]EAW45603.1 two-component hybrid sensor and regulator [Nodularia spumigena CCY9414]MDB9383931.1 response regulator [Nodularia spumigena CS-584]